MANAAEEEAAGAQAGANDKEVEFSIEVHEAGGFPRPEQTSVELSGFCIEGVQMSVPAEGESEVQSGWQFLGMEAARAEQEKAKAAAADPKAKAKPKPAPKDPSTAASDELEPILRIALPRETLSERQQVLDSTVNPLTVTFVRAGEQRLVLGSCELSLQDLVHETGALSFNTAVQWSKEYLAELREEAHAKAKAEAEAAAAEAGGEEGAAGAGEEAAAEDGGIAQEDEPAFEFHEPAPGSLRVSASVLGGPIGRSLCPEDLDDWAVLTVKLEGCFRPPTKLLEVSGPLPAGTVGRLDEHPLQFGLDFLGCGFHGGRWVVPEKPPAEHPVEAEQQQEAQAGEAQEGEEGPPPQSPPPGFEVGKEEFVEGLMRAGFVRAQQDGPAIFEFLTRASPGMDARMSIHEFSQFAEFPALASPAQLLGFHSALLQKYNSLDEAFQALDAAQEGALMPDSFKAGLEAIGHACSPEEADALFGALDGQGAGAIGRQDFLALELHKRLADMAAAEKAAKWLLDCCGGSVEEVWRQSDSSRAGGVPLEGWKAVLSRLGYPGQEGDAQALLLLLGVAAEGEVSRPALDRLPRFNAEELAEAADLLDGAVSAAGGATFLGDAGVLDEPGFAAACGCATAVPEKSVGALFALLQGPQAQVGPDELAVLSAMCAGVHRTRIAACKAFVDAAFEKPTDAFRKLFDDQGEALKEAEAFEPRIEWPQAATTRYCGRSWLQRLLNTLNDERGRNFDASDGGGGAWLHFFPLLASQDKAVDFKEIPEAALSGQARIARWHHGQGWVDLRRMLGDGSGAPEFEFRAFVSQVGLQPTGINEAGDLAAAPFGACRTYVKGTIKLDRPLVQLCPRDIPPLPEACGEPFIPPPPQKPPPPTAGEELELETRKVVGRLAVEFARLARERGLEEQQRVLPGNEVGPHALLGRQATERGALLEWLQGQDGAYKELAAELRPVVARLVRSEAKNGPACGISGNKQDAMYSGIRDLIMKHLFRGLNHEVRAQKQQRDAALWRSDPLNSRADDCDPRFAKPADLAAHHAEQDVTLQRLVFECELLGDLDRATELFRERLALPQNVEKGDCWYEFARFLMRCGQRQPEAEEALRYAISLRPPSEGPSLHEAAFLAFILQNYEQPSALGSPEGKQLARFDAANSLLAARVDRMPAEQVPLLLMFALFALEAEGVRGQLEAALEVGGEQSQEAEELGAALDSLVAEAKKYISLARQSPGVFHSTLVTHGTGGHPRFPELDRLVERERLNRGETKELPPRPDLPAAWEEKKHPAFPSASSVHPAPEAADTAALECIDLLLHFGLPGFVNFLVKEVPQEFGFLSPNSKNSERCRLQLVHAAMLDNDWKEAAKLIHQLFETCSDRLPEVHALLGESLFRSVREGGVPHTSQEYQPALEALQQALSFYPTGDGADDASAAASDPVLHLRIAHIHYMKAQESGCSDTESMDKAVFHFKQSLLECPTAEAWRSAGVCTYRKAELARKGGQPASRVAELLWEALGYLREANVLDKVRPKINAHLVTCAVQLGEVLMAKQALREVLRHADALDFQTGLELAEVLLERSDESLSRLAGRESERGLLSQDGRYAHEAIAVASALASQHSSPEAHYVRARAHMLLGEHAKAVGCFCQALELSDESSGNFDEMAQAARGCAGLLVGESHFAVSVEQAVARAKGHASAEAVPEE